MMESFQMIHQKATTFLEYACFLVVLIIGFLLISSMFRFLFGKRAQIGKSITSAMEILCLYVLWIAIFCLGLPWDLFVEPLPFLSIKNGYFQVFSIISSDFGNTCTQFLKLLMIAFLVNLMNSIIPEGKKIVVWLFLRVITVLLAIVVNYVLDVALQMWLPQGFGQYAPLILIGVLALLIALGSLKLIVGMTLFVANPLIGALYTFFFSNLIGRALARSIISAGMITALVYCLNTLGIFTIALTFSTMVSLLPLFLIVILLWYGIDRIV